MVSVTCWLWVKPPLVAVMVRVKVPVGVFRLVLMVSAVDPAALREVGLKLVPARRGTPLTLKLTVPLKPAPGVKLTRYCALPPCVTLVLPGLTLMAKSALTTNVTPAVCVRAPLVAVMVNE